MAAKKKKAVTNLSTILADRAIGRVLALQRFAAGQNREVQKMLVELERSLAADLEASGVGEVIAASRQRTRLENLLESTRDAIRETYSEINKTQRTGLLGLVKVEQDFLVKDATTVIGVDITGITLSPQQLRVIASDTLIEGAPSKEWWSKQAGDTQQRFANSVREGMLRGEDNRQITSRVRGTKAGGYKDGVMEVPKRQAETLVRTSVQSVSNEARQQLYEENKDIVKGIQWVSTLDSRTTVTCMALDGKQWSLPDYEPIGHDIPFPGATAHWGCFTGEVPVEASTEIRRLYRRPYSGKLFTLKTDGGRCITATPNHPVLTRTGWKAISQVEIGDYLICQKSNRAFSTRSPNDQSNVTTFAKLAEATAKLSGVLPVEVPVAGPDFHGDGTESEVGQIWTYGRLGNERHTAIAEFLSNGKLKFGNLDVSEALPGQGHLLALPDSFLAASGGSMGGLSVGYDPAGPTLVQVLTPRSRYASSFTPSVQSVETDAELRGDLPRGMLVSDVQIDRVRMVSGREAVSVLVHNLETEGHWYWADGIASHNCRSTQIAVYKSFAELAKPGAVRTPAGGNSNIDAIFRRNLAEMGMSQDEIDKAVYNARASMDGQVSANMNFEDWLGTKSKSFQDETLGPGRAELWREDKITMTEMLDQRGRPLSLEDLKKK